MKNIAFLFLTATLIVSCGEEVNKSSLDELNSTKSTITSKIDSLTKELKAVEAQIAKLDTTHKIHLVTTLPVKNAEFKHFVEVQGIVKADKNIEIPRFTVNTFSPLGVLISTQKGVIRL